jgi:hypothetical protein
MPRPTACVGTSRGSPDKIRWPGPDEQDADRCSRAALPALPNLLSLVAAGMIVALLAWLYLVHEARYGTRDVMVHAMRTAGISGVIATGGLTCLFYRLVR